MRDTNDNEAGAVGPLEKLQAQLTMARKMTAMMEKGYAALLHHGVNYKSLPAFKNTELLDDAGKAPFRRGVQLIHRYLESVEKAIDGAVRRKGMRLVPA